MLGCWVAGDFSSEQICILSSFHRASWQPLQLSQPCHVPQRLMPQSPEKHSPSQDRYLYRDSRTREATAAGEARLRVARGVVRHVCNPSTWELEAGGLHEFMARMCYLVSS